MSFLYPVKVAKGALGLVGRFRNVVVKSANSCIYILFLKALSASVHLLVKSFGGRLAVVCR